MSGKVKLTVVKVVSPSEAFEEMPVKLKYDGPCPFHKLGDELIVDSMAKPEGMCDFAWNTIWPYAMAIRIGGDFSDIYEEPGTALVCCPDAARPVSFKIERF